MTINKFLEVTLQTVNSKLQGKNPALVTDFWVPLELLCVFSSSHVWMWELDYKESWVLKNWCFWTVVLEKTLESPLDCKIQPVHPKGDQSWVFIGRTDAEAETPILWPPERRADSLEKNPDAGKDWGQEEKGTAKDEMVGWHHQLDGHGVWVDSRSWWWTPERPGMLWFMGSQRVGHDWATELNCVTVLAALKTQELSLWWTAFHSHPKVRYRESWL